MIEKSVIKGMFWERNSIDIEPFVNTVAQMVCYPISNPKEEIIFIGSIEYDDNFPMLRVGFPWYEGEKTAFARETAVSPNIEEPKAYYMLKSIYSVSDDTVDKWFNASKKFVKTLENDEK